jgi:hypothetical protein
MSCDGENILISKDAVREITIDKDIGIKNLPA